MEGPKQAVQRRKPTNITEFKWFCTKEWAKTPTCYCAGLISIYKKLYLQLLQQKGVTPDTESKDSHTFCNAQICNTGSIFSINKWQRKYFSLTCLIRFSLSAFRTQNLMMFWIIFMQKYRKFLRVHKLSSSTVYIYILYPLCVCIFIYIYIHSSLTLVNGLMI